VNPTLTERHGMLVRADDPILRKRARELTASSRPHAVIATMREVLAALGGVGIAAPQLGVDWRLFILADDPEPFINPVIVARSAETDVQDEGCLSLPGVIVPVRRNIQVAVERKGRVVLLMGSAARIAQHEIDHLDGKLITDYAMGVTPTPQDHP